jgi:hypothetical protein
MSKVKKIRTSKVFSERRKSLCRKERQKSDKLDFRRSDITYGIKKDQNVESLICMISDFDEVISSDQLPMA